MKKIYNLISSQTQLIENFASEAESIGKTTSLQLMKITMIIMLMTSGAAFAQQTCDLADYSGNRVIWLNINGSISNYEVHGSSVFVDNGDGTAVLSGTYVDKANSNNKFDMTINLINKRNWSQWSALGRSYKNGGGGDHTTWDYFEVDNGSSTLTGVGGLAGVNLSISHNPANYNYGFQVGNGANDKNGSYGTSGWFGISGSWTGHGDINSDLKYCTQCSNVCRPGEIAGIEYDCSSYDPSPITSISLPSGGHGIIEYVWLSNSTPSTSGATVIAGANGPSYDPGPITQTTYFRRCARRSGCSSYPGESNWICKVVGNSTCPTGATTIQGYANSVISNNGVGYAANLLGAADGSNAQFWDNGDYVIIDLDETLNAGDQLCIKWKERNYSSSYSGDATLKIYEYSNGSYIYNSSVTTNSKDYIYSCITIANSTNQIKLKNPGCLPDFDIDGLVFCYCSTPCLLTVDAGPDQISCGNNVTLTATSAGAATCNTSTCCGPETLLKWDMDACLSCGTDGGDYSEFVPSSSATCMTASGLALSSTAGHSCTAGANGTNRAPCILDGNSFYLNGTFTPPAGETGKISGISYYVANPLSTLQSPPCGTWQSGYNISYYKIKVRKNGSVVYSETRPLPNSWTLENLDFSGNTSFSFTGSTDFEFQLTVYGISGKGYFDIDEFEVSGESCSSGTTSDVSYLWSTGATTASITVNQNGQYIVTATDCEGCIAMDTVNVNTDNVTASAVPTDATCFAYSDGSIDLTVVGGTAPFTFAWSNGASSEDINGLVAGSYSVLVTDANGCTAAVNNIIVGEPALLTAACNPSDVSCNGGSDGAVSLTVGGGTAPYAFLWSNGATTKDISGLAAGSYNVVVTDANNCSAACSATVNEPTPISIGINPTNVSCNGGSDGAINITVSGGTPAYSFLWSNGATSEDLINITAGTYSVVVTDANNCTATSSSITVNEPGAISASAIPTDATCNGYSDGSIDASVSGGTPPYTYSWSNGANTEDISGLTAGTYTLNILDANGCSATTSAVVGEPSSVQAGAVATDATCFAGNNGSIDLTVSGGTPPYTYNWSNGANTEDLANLSAATYSATVTDANGCVANASATVGEPSALGFNHSTIDATCADGMDGSATVTPFGGTAPYSYLWSTGATTPTATGLGKGTYPVTITDANGCFITDTATIIIDAPDAIVMSITDSARLCLITSSLAPYPHGTIMNNQWNGITISAIAGPGGVDTVAIFDSNITGTSDPDLEVGIGPLLTIVENVVDTNNDGILDDVDDNQFGGLLVFDFDELVRINDFSFVDQDINTLPTVTAFDSTGAIILQILVPNMGDGSVQTVAMNVSGVARLEIFSITSYAVTHFDIDCGVVQGGCIDGSADLTVSGGTPPYTFLWSNGATTEDLAGVPCATYTVIVTDANNCSMSRSVTIDPNTAAITCNVTPQNVTSCSGAGTASISQVQGGIAPYTYMWNTTPQQYGPVATGLSEGLYYVVITDANGCTAIETVQIEADPEIAAYATVTAASCFDAADGTFDLNIYEGVGPFTFLWSDGSVASSRNDLSRGVHSVVVTDANGCDRTFTQWVNSPGRLFVGAYTRKVVCEGDNNGLFEVHVAGGVAPYTFLWNDGATSQNRYNLSKGVYTVTVTDGSGCDRTITRWIGQKYYINVGGVQTNVSQVGATDGMAVAWGMGGLAPYTYEWNTTPVQNTPTARNLAEGIYVVKVTDSRGCVRYRAFNIVAVGNGANRVEEVTATFELNAFPNPTDGELHLNIDTSIPGQYQIDMLDVTGRQMFSESGSTEFGENYRSFDFTTLPAGVYMLKFEMNNQREIIRIVLD